jgi:hypothetical protein
MEAEHGPHDGCDVAHEVEEQGVWKNLTETIDAERIFWCSNLPNVL